MVGLEGVEELAPVKYVNDLIMRNNDPIDTPIIQGIPAAYSPGKVDYPGVFKNLTTIGFQATNVGMAIQETQAMLADSSFIILAMTSNIVSSGLREIVHFVLETGRIGAVVCTAGGIEEDFIKCLGTTHLGSFDLNGHELRKAGHNRIGNLIIPNENYCRFETWITPVLNAMLAEQKEGGVRWTPSLLIERFGNEMQDWSSLWKVCASKRIPVFSPALLDGSIGDQVYWHSMEHPGLIIDAQADFAKLVSLVQGAEKVGVIAVETGLVFHTALNAARYRKKPVEHCVVFSTSGQGETADGESHPEDSWVWTEEELQQRMVTVKCDVTVVLPVVVGETFAQISLAS